MALMEQEWTPLIPRAADEVPFRDDGTLRRWGPFVARLDCGHDYGQAAGYVGEALYVGDTVECSPCQPVAPHDTPKDVVPVEAPPVKPRTVIDVVYTGPEQAAGSRRW